MELEPIEKHRLALPAEEVDNCLLALALNGGAIARTVRELKQSGVKVSADQIADWRDKFPKRYFWHCTENAAKLEGEVLASYRELIARSTEASLKAVEIEAERLAAGEVKDAAATARNLSTVFGITTTKLLELSGRPTQITEVRKPEQIMASLKRYGVNIVDSDAEEDK